MRKNKMLNQKNKIMKKKEVSNLEILENLVKDLKKEKRKIDIDIDEYKNYADIEGQNIRINIYIQNYKKKTVDGYSVDGDDMHYKAGCPHCGYETEWEGWFDPDDEHKCLNCERVFYINKIWLNDNEYIQ